MLYPNLSSFILSIPALLLAITMHEYAHGKMAALLGDPTPAREGRLSLNPLAHLDLMGTLMMLIFHFGWAKPVQVNPFHFRGDRIKGMMLVGLAGPVMNFILAYLGAVGAQLLARHAGSPQAVDILQYIVLYNAMFGVFNLIPLPPLDGSRVLAGLLPGSGARFVYQMEAYGPLLLILLLATGVVGRILGPLVNAVLRGIYYLSSLAWM